MEKHLELRLYTWDGHALLTVERTGTIFFSLTLKCPISCVCFFFFFKCKLSQLINNTILKGGLAFVTEKCAHSLSSFGLTNKTHQLLSQFHRMSETRTNVSVSRLPSGYFKRRVQFTEPPGSSSALLAVKVNVILHNDGRVALGITRRDVSILQSASQLKLKHLQSSESFYQRKEGSQTAILETHSRDAERAPQRR